MNPNLIYRREDVGHGLVCGRSIAPTQTAPQAPPEFAMSYKIELRYTSGWDDAGWFDETEGKSKPTRFGTFAEAQVALDDFFADVKSAVAAGDMKTDDDHTDYRIVAVDD